MSLGLGIDISSKKVDAALSDGTSLGTYPNTKKGLRSLVSRVKRYAIHRVVIEASGGYERRSLHELHAAGHQVVFIEAGRARHFAKAIGQHAKTDALDALMLAKMAAYAVNDEPLYSPQEEAVRVLRSLVDRRRELVNDIERDRKRLRMASGFALSSLKVSLATDEEQLAAADQAIQAHIKKHKRLLKGAKALKGVCGVGDVFAASLMALLPELGRLNRQAIAALVGVAPMNNDSGKHSGVRSIRRGRSRIRRVLYMVTLVAVRHNKHLKPHYERLVSRGKKKKVALVACMRKFITYLNTVMRGVLEDVSPQPQDA